MRFADWLPRQSATGLRPAAEVASRLAACHLLLDCPGCNVDAIARCKLVIGRRITELHDVAEADRQNDAAAFWRCWTGEDNIGPRCPIRQVSGGDQTIEDCFASVQLKGPWCVHLAQDIENLAHSRDQLHADLRRLGFLGGNGGTYHVLDLLHRLAGHHEPAILEQIDGSIRRHGLVPRQPQRRIEVDRLHANHVAGLDDIRSQHLLIELRGRAAGTGWRSSLAASVIW